MKLIDRAVELYIAGGLSLVPINTHTKRPAGWLLPQDTDEHGQPLFYRQHADGTFEATTDDTGKPKGTWKPFQVRQPNEEEIARWRAANVQAYAVIGGPVSGGVEIIDFDVQGYFEQWAELVAPEIVGLPVQRTGGGGMQLAWRCPEPEPNQKLAWHPDATQHAGRRVAIETRGVNGYAVLPPSLHPSGRHYTLVSGRFSQIPTIDQDVRDFLLNIARSLCQAPKTRQEMEREAAGLHRGPRNEPYEGDSVIEAYNARHSVELMLQRYGYTRMGNGRYSRPGKTDSAGVVVWTDENKTYNMSSNDPLDSDAMGLAQPRSPFDYYLEFEHSGDYTSAVRTAAKELGMIDPRTIDRNTERFFATMAGR